MGDQPSNAQLDEAVPDATDVLLDEHGPKYRGVPVLSLAPLDVSSLAPWGTQRLQPERRCGAMQGMNRKDWLLVVGVLLIILAAMARLLL